MVATWPHVAKLGAGMDQSKPTAERVKLTAERIGNFGLPDGKSQAFLRDKDVPQLAVRVTPGSKSFVFESKLNRQTVRVTIGSTDSWLLETVWGKDADDRKVKVQQGARDEARRLQTVVDAGSDPREQKRERFAANEATKQERTRRNKELERQALPAIEVWEHYLKVKTPRWSARHLDDHQREAKPPGINPRTKQPTGAGSLHALLTANRLVDLNEDAIKTWLKAATDKAPTRGALAFRLLRGFIRWAAVQKEYKALVHPDAVAGGTVKDILTKPQAKKNDCLQREMLPAWFTAVRQLSNPVIPAYLQILLLTGARRNELTGLKWVDVDFKWNSVTIRDKVEGERVIPLTPYVASLLTELKRASLTPKIRRLRSPTPPPDWKPSEWVFTGRYADSERLMEPRIGHDRALGVAGLPHISIHGLRRSFGTLAEWVECPTGVAAQIMGHKPSAIAEKHYRQRPLDLLRSWHVKIEAWILNEAGIQQPTVEDQQLNSSQQSATLQRVA